MTKAYEIWHHTALRHRWSTCALSWFSIHVSSPHSATKESSVRSLSISQKISKRLPCVQLNRHFAIQAIPISFTRMKKKVVHKSASILFPQITRCESATLSLLLDHHLVSQFLNMTITLHLFSSYPAGRLWGALCILSGNIHPSIHGITMPQNENKKKRRQLSPLVTDEKQAACGPSATQLESFLPAAHCLSLKFERTSWHVSRV